MRPHFCESPFYREKVASQKQLRSPFLRIPILLEMALGGQPALASFAVDRMQNLVEILVNLSPKC